VSDIFTRYGSNITNVWQEILTPVTLAFSIEVVHEKNMKICQYYFVKVTAKKSVSPFLCGHGVDTAQGWPGLGGVRCNMANV